MKDALIVVPAVIEARGLYVLQFVLFNQLSQPLKQERIVLIHRKLVIKLFIDLDFFLLRFINNFLQIPYQSDNIVKYPFRVRSKQG